MAADDYYTTRLLYLEDSYIKEFDAVVVKSGPRYVILDQTAFYPEGGGQPSDTGVFRYLKHEAQVVKVKKRGKDIYHHLNVDIPVGTRVHGIVNWEPRFENMRRHSGEHLLTGLFTAAGSGPKIYSDLYKLEFRPSELSNEDVRKVENLFNSIVEADLPLIIYDINRKEVEGEKDPRRKSFLDKIPRNIEELRIVEIPEHSHVFCLGTHVKSTRDIGKIGKITLEKGKKSLRRVIFTLK